MTIAHEIAHYFLIVVNGVKLYRTFKEIDTPKYCDPEWQAKALAGELLCPFHLIEGLSRDRIANKCGVSDRATITLYNIRNS
jgi:Zn-dependent peptidase ImmA (M78 family)